jgi:CMP-N,N'-diacetyllegionaminic acid synthase
MKYKLVALIPARSGSKRIKNKNISLLNKKPLLAYSIIEAQKTNLFEKIVVSTDSIKYKNIALKYGATVPYLRKKKILRIGFSRFLLGKRFIQVF